MREEDEPDRGAGAATRPLSEAREAVRSLSDADKKRLLTAAKFWAYRFDIKRRLGEPADLLQEALVRILNGDRKWPSKVGFPKFVSNTMRSIAGHLKGHEIGQDEAGAKSVLFYRVPPATAESRAAAAEELADLEQFLSDDPELLRVLKLKAADWKPSEIRAELDLSEKQWQTVERRARRKLTKLRGTGE